jgi:hypothetical protein
LLAVVLAVVNRQLSPTRAAAAALAVIERPQVFL